MIGSSLSFLGLMFVYSKSNLLIIIFLVAIFMFSAISSPFLFAKIMNIVPNNQKISSMIVFYIIWFSGGLFYSFLFNYISITFSFFVAFLSISVGLVYHYITVFKNKNLVRIQLLPFRYSSIANVNVIGIFFVLTLFWSVSMIILKEISINMTNNFGSKDGFFFSFFFFMSINTVIGFVFYKLNKRIDLQLVYYVDYVIISLSVVTILFWSDGIPIAFFLVSTFGITSFALSMPDLIDSNKGIIGLSFMSFFYVLLLSFPIIHVLVFLLDNKVSGIIASYLLIIIIIAMALISGIKFLPLPSNIEYLIISHRDGHPLLTRGTASRDEKIISGLLTGILTILSSDSTSNKIKTIDHGDKKIIVSMSNRLFGVIVCDRYNRSLGTKLQEIVDLFEAGFDKVLDLNSFNLQLFKNLPPVLKRKLDYLIEI